MGRSFLIVLCSKSFFSINIIFLILVISVRPCSPCISFVIAFTKMSGIMLARYLISYPKIPSYPEAALLFSLRFYFCLAEPPFALLSFLIFCWELCCAFVETKGSYRSWRSNNKNLGFLSKKSGTSFMVPKWQIWTWGIYNEDTELKFSTEILIHINLGLKQDQRSIAQTSDLGQQVSQSESQPKIVLTK